MMEKQSNTTKKTHLHVGGQAPLFRFKDEYGEEKSLGDLKGKKIILFFYPKDLTPGCIAEACNLRDNYTHLLSLGFYIIGISADTEKRHKHFRALFKFPFPLYADTDMSVIHAYKVWGRKKFMGREFEGILRTTYIIDEKGIIEHVIEKVKTKHHTKQILELLNLN
ncbi:MAG: thioredoxin-dependent thiol peroxidase [Flavobacteriales bacterium]